LIFAVPILCTAKIKMGPCLRRDDEPLT
jgi:hypothetical protein